jgi:hypothetical protein
VPFQEKEMDDVIKEMPMGRTIGSECFNGMFLKKCWPIIKNEFYSLAADFYNEIVRLQNINGSFITLVPKK